MSCCRSSPTAPNLTTSHSARDSASHASLEASVSGTVVADPSAAEALASVVVFSATGSLVTLVKLLRRLPGQVEDHSDEGVLAEGLEVPA